MTIREGDRPTEGPRADLLDALEDTRARSSADDPSDFMARCDSCAEPIQPNGTVVTAFFVDETITGRSAAEETPGPGGSAWVFFRIHCPDCSHGVLLMPAQGYTELLLRTEVHLDESDTPRLRNWRYLQVSGPDDGYPWAPRDVLQRILDIMAGGDADEYPKMDELGPADVVDILALYGLNPRELVNEAGEWDPQVSKKQIQKGVLSSVDHLNPKVAREHAQERGVDPDDAETAFEITRKMARAERKRRGLDDE